MKLSWRIVCLNTGWGTEQDKANLDT